MNYYLLTVRLAHTRGSLVLHPGQFAQTKKELINGAVSRLYSYFVKISNYASL